MTLAKGTAVKKTNSEEGDNTEDGATGVITDFIEVSYEQGLKATIEVRKIRGSRLNMPDDHIVRAMYFVAWDGTDIISVISDYKVTPVEVAIVVPFEGSDLN